jgi:hypothetical protein
VLAKIGYNPIIISIAPIIILESLDKPPHQTAYRIRFMALNCDGMRAALEKGVPRF